MILKRAACEFPSLVVKKNRGDPSQRHFRPYEWGEKGRKTR